MKLYGYWRSSAAYRVRIALYLKDIEFDNISVHLVKDGGQQLGEFYTEINPSQLVPTLVDGDVKISQSLAILNYIDNLYPQSGLYGKNPIERSQIEALAFDIACDIHPLNNLRVLKFLSGEMQLDNDQKSKWYAHWIQHGFSALEQKLCHTSGDFSVGDTVSAVDLCLVPQVYNANRFNVDLTAFPLINSIVERCNQLPAFIKALPENQPDAS